MIYIFVIIVASLSLAVILYRYFLGLSFRIAGWIGLGKIIGEIKKDYSWQPVVTFMVPCFNEGEHIGETIKSILSQDWPKDKLEVIVIDDMSSDDTYEWALKTHELGDVKVFRNESNLGKRKSLVKATQMANGEICVSVDSDVILAPDALKELVSCFAQNPKVGAVGGRVGISNPNTNWITQTQVIKYFFSYELFKSTENAFRTIMCLSGCLTAYRRIALVEIEDQLKDRRWMNSPIKYGEDRYLTHLLVLNGWQTILNLEAKCWTKSPTDLSGLFSQQLRWRRSNIIDWILTASRLREHFHVLNTLVLLGYICLALYISSYPLVLAQAIASGFILEVVVIHLVILVALSAIYQTTMMLRGEKGVRSPEVYLGLGLVLAVSYLIITPLAAFTLDSMSWETRQKKEEYQSEI